MQNLSHTTQLCEAAISRDQDLENFLGSKRVCARIISVESNVVNYGPINISRSVDTRSVLCALIAQFFQGCHIEQDILSAF